jgi:hypothetical protein
MNAQRILAAALLAVAAVGAVACNQTQAAPKQVDVDSMLERAERGEQVRR